MLGKHQACVCPAQPFEAASHHTSAARQPLLAPACTVRPCRLRLWACRVGSCLHRQALPPQALGLPCGLVPCRGLPAQCGAHGQPCPVAVPARHPSVRVRRKRGRSLPPESHGNSVGAGHPPRVVGRCRRPGCFGGGGGVCVAPGARVPVAVLSLALRCRPSLQQLLSGAITAGAPVGLPEGLPPAPVSDSPSPSLPAPAAGGAAAAATDSRRGIHCLLLPALQVVSLIMALSRVIPLAPMPPDQTTERGSWIKVAAAPPPCLCRHHPHCRLLPPVPLQAFGDEQLATRAYDSDPLVIKSMPMGAAGETGGGGRGGGSDDSTASYAVRV